MHVPDGFIDAPVSIAAGAVAVAGVGIALRGARRELDDRTAPLAGLTAAFVFAAQMLNFPVAAGTSGHLLGGALAAILVGPYAGMLAVSVVLFLQALLFADGGLSALGVNIASALAFTLIYAAGGTADVSIGKVAAAMLGVHVLIGIGEALITAVTVSSVLAVRPDLVYGARGLVKPVELRTSPPTPSQA